MPTLLDVHETFGENRRSGIETETNKSFSRVFNVNFDGYVVNLNDVLDAAGVPSIGDWYVDSSTNATVRSKEVVEKDGTRSHFNVIVNYDTAIDNTTGTINPTNPLADLWKISGGSRDRTIAATNLRLADSAPANPPQPVRNKAFDDFDPVPTIKSNDLFFTLTKNYSSIQWTLIQSQNYVNDAAVTIWGKSFAKRTLFLDSVSFSGYQERNGVGFYAHTFSLLFRVTTWDLKLANVGFNELKVAGDPKTKQRIRLLGKTPAQQAQPLDTNGQYGPNLTPPVDPTEMTVDYELPSVDYSIFSFPTTAQE